MARDEKIPDKGRVKVRVIEFELDGSNQTLRDSIRDIVGAIGGRPAQAVRQPNPAAIGNGSRTPAAEAPAPADDGTNGEFDETVVSVTDADDESPRQAKRRNPPRSPEIIELDFNTAAMRLTDFCEKLKPESDTDKYSVIAFWLKHFGIAAEVTMDHIHTGYRHMKWNTPADAGQPLRNLKTRQYGYVTKGSKPGAFILNHVGENHVRDLIKGAGFSL
ncbi:MAG: hypothetical protein M3O41_08440 [Pseudomonadota bacterium]|nr:hypothetical protein [Pseudomonadota bacterium]